MASTLPTAPQSVPSLLDIFPVEIVERVLLNLDGSDIVACLEVSQTMRAVIKSSLHLRYKMECYLARVEDNPSKSGLPVIERLEKVRNWHKTFTAGEWKSDGSRMIIIHSGSEHEGDRFTFSVYGPAYVVQIGRSFQTIQPPSPFRGRPEERWDIEDIGFPVHTFAYDHHEQILALAEMGDDSRFRIHLKLPTGAEHPLAAAPIIHVEPPYAHMIHTLPGFELHMQIRSDFLLVVVDRRFSLQGRPQTDHGIFVFNWKTGGVLLDLQESRETTFQKNVSFLNSEYLLIPIGDTDAYGLTELSGPRGGCIAILALYPGCPTRRSVREAVNSAVLLLGLPDPMDSDTCYRGILCASPSPFSAEKVAHSSDIFSNCSEASLLGFKLAITGRLGGERLHRTVNVFVLREAVMYFLALSAREDGAARGYVPWSRLTTYAATLTSQFGPGVFASSFADSRCFYAVQRMTPDTAMVTTHDFFSEKMYEMRERLSRHWQSDVDLGPEPFACRDGLDKGRRIYAQTTQMEFELSSKEAVLRAGEDFLLLVYNHADNPGVSFIETYLL